jgi:hypothetical protein
MNVSQSSLFSLLIVNPIILEQLGNLQAASRDLDEDG